MACIIIICSFSMISAAGMSFVWCSFFFLVVEVLLFCNILYVTPILFLILCLHHIYSLKLNYFWTFKYRFVILTCGSARFCWLLYNLQCHGMITPTRKKGAQVIKCSLQQYIDDGFHSERENNNYTSKPIMLQRTLVLLSFFSAYLGVTEAGCNCQISWRVVQTLGEGK